MAEQDYDEIELDEVEDELLEEKEEDGTLEAADGDDDNEDEDDDDDEDDDEDDDDDEEDEDDLKDPLIEARKHCVDSYECSGFKHAFNSCVTRVNDEGIKENCTPEFFDLLECRDKCVSHGDIFDILK